jgi:hypothetical protein
MLGHGRDESFGELSDRDVVGGIADVEDAAVGGALAVLEDLHQAVDPVRDVGEGAALRASVHELDRLPVEHVVQELRQNPARALLRRIDVV